MRSIADNNEEQSGLIQWIKSNFTLHFQEFVKAGFYFLV